MRQALCRFRARSFLAVALSACVGDQAQVNPLDCPAGQVVCEGGCVSLAADPDHCGACTSACAAGQICTAGACAAGCGDGTQRCGDRCVDTLVDPQHCGACDRPCPQGEVCSLGGCALECGGGTTLCDGLCVSLESNAGYCGDCDSACATGSLCIDSACVAPTSCKDLHQKSPALADGSYTLDPDGAGGALPFSAHCDMTIEGGGWTLVASVVDNRFFAGTVCSTACDTNPGSTCDETPFTSASVVGDTATMLVTDHKSAAYGSVPFNEMLFVDDLGQYVSYDVSGPNVLDWFPAGLENYVAAGVEAHPSYSYPAKATNIEPSLNNCGTLRVSFNVEDSDTVPGNTCHSSKKGPAWARLNNSACFWDEAGLAWTGNAFYPGNDTSYRLWLVR